ncbi:MAG TPA: class I SAM-dependent methyltransferase [Chloroflexota bacterium]|jgi:ubiquinone/menaquinone biosynthesis C-methylase UbiE
MALPEYEYRGMKAACWDLLRGDTSTWPDRPFYFAVIQRSGTPVLDVGCGTGRLLLDFLGAGVDIHGVDNSPEMLDLCRHKALRLGLQPVLFEQQMEELDLPHRYRTIIVPSSSFQLVTHTDAAARAMRGFFRHLEPGGILLMPFMLLGPRPGQSGDAEDEWKLVQEAARPEDGAIVRRWARATYDVANQLEHTEDRYEVIRGNEIIDSEYQTRSDATRWYTQQQAARLFGVSGFTDVRVVSSFTEEIATAEDTVFSVFGTRPVANLS